MRCNLCWLQTLEGYKRTTLFSDINARWLHTFLPSVSAWHFRLRYLPISCSVIWRITICGRYLRRGEDYDWKFSYLQSSHESMFWSTKKPFKKDLNDYIIYNLWFRVTCTTFHNLQNTNLQNIFIGSLYQDNKYSYWWWHCQKTFTF